jgi:dipeptidyl aminopeptidase/acylaminoacyl peptidase
VKTPTLVVHGDKDDRVPVSQGWELYVGLKKAGVPTDLLILPRQPHGPREPKLLKACVKWHREWIDKYTLGTPSTTAAGAEASLP